MTTAEAVAASEAKVTELAGSIADLYAAIVECDQAGGDVQRAFSAGLPREFVADLVRQEPMLGSIFLLLGVPVG